MYWISLLVSTLLLGWLHVHTDELPIVLGCVVAVSAAVSLAFPARFLVSWLILGGTLFCTETLVHFGLLNASYGPGAAVPWAALFGYVPAAIGVGAGTLGRRALAPF